MEGYDYEFVPHPESRYECSICLLVLREPHQTKCGHIFCRNCILKSLRDSSSRCPMDNEPLKETDIYPDNFAKREISNFNIICPNNKDGCDKIFPLGKLQSHLKECPSACVPCPFKCSSIVQRMSIEDHLTSSCKNRLVGCEHCNTEMRAELIQCHVMICPKAVVSCPHCQKKKTRSEMDDHIQNECPKIKVRCPFYQLGCTSSMMRGLVDQHLLHDGSSHLKQLCQAVTTLARKLGIANLVCQTSSKSLIENRNLVHSSSSKFIRDSQDPIQNGSCPVNGSTDEMSISPETLLTHMHTLILQHEDRIGGEKNLPVQSGAGYIPNSSLCNGQNGVTPRQRLDSDPGSNSNQNCKPLMPLQNSRTNNPLHRHYNHSHSSPTAVASVNHDSNSPSCLFIDQMNEVSNYTSSDVKKLIQEISSRFENREAVLHQKLEELQSKFTVVERENSVLVKIVRDVEQHVIETSAKFYNGDFCWCINNFSQYRLKLESGESSMLHSPPFYTSPWGYKMCIRVNIDKCSGSEQLSLFVHFMKSENDAYLTWPFSGKIIICVVDQNPDCSKRVHIKETLEGNPNLASFQRPTTTRNHKGFGYMSFLSIAALENGSFLMQDTLVIKTQVFSNSQ